MRRWRTPFHTFPPVRQAANKFAAIRFWACRGGAHPTEKKRGDGEDMNAVRGRPVSTPPGATRRKSKLPRAPGAPVFRPASRGSAKPAPMTLRHAQVRAASLRIHDRRGCAGRPDLQNSSTPPVGAGAPTHLQQLRQEGPGGAGHDQRPPGAAPAADWGSPNQDPSSSSSLHAATSCFALVVNVTSASPSGGAGRVSRAPPGRRTARRSDPESI